MAAGAIATGIGFLLLARCAWAVSQYRDMLTLTQQEFWGLPQHLQLELLVAVVLCCIGGLISAGSMKPIVISKAGPSMDSGSLRPDFVQLNHRGKALPLPAAAAALAT